MIYKLEKNLDLIIYLDVQSTLDVLTIELELLSQTEGLCIKDIGLDMKQRQ